MSEMRNSGFCCLDRAIVGVCLGDTGGQWGRIVE